MALILAGSALLLIVCRRFASAGWVLASQLAVIGTAALAVVWLGAGHGQHEYAIYRHGLLAFFGIAR